MDELLKKELKGKILKKLESMEETLKYQIETNCELLSNIQILYYLFFSYENKNE